VPPLALWNVDDASAFCWAIVRKTGLGLDFHDAEDLHQYLFTECWRLSLRYQPGGPDFDGWAAKILRVRVVDWERQRSGRTKWAFKDHTYERSRPQLVSLDAGLGDAEPSGSGDLEDGCAPNLQRVLGTGSGTRARDFEALGLNPPR
jgi:DNA-directed RNA polymerase specialized sigma24 family protein